MLFKLLVGVEWILFIVTTLIFIILLTMVSKMKPTQFARLFSFSKSKQKNLAEIKAQLLKQTTVLPRVSVNIIVSSAIAIISLAVIWFLLQKEYINRSIDPDIIVMGIAAIIPVPIAISLFEYCVNRMSKRVDELIGEGE